MNSLARENLELRSQLEQLQRTAQLNHEAGRRAAQREHRLLCAEGLAALLDELAVSAQRRFKVTAAQLVLIDPEHEIRHLLAATARDGMRCPQHAIRFLEDERQLPPQLRDLRAPTLGRYRSSDAVLFPRHGVSTLGSLALLPLRRGGRLLGALCLGDADAARFDPDLATDNLRNLSVVGAISLENALNRDRLLVGAITDPLTGLHNRRYLDSRLREAIARARRERSPLACLLLDLDYFKRVNDTYGHLAGDEVLREVARRIQGAVRASDVCARYGGEELAVVLPDTRRVEAEALAERLRQVVCGAPIPVVSGRAITVTSSIGVATAAPGTSLDPSETSAAVRDLLQAADQALFRAKAEGRDRVCNAA
ncbi:MAG: sensor domain-containing diguanylate cyclase [Pseudomonadota bacterium]